LEDNFVEAEQQLEFLTEIQSATGTSSLSHSPLLSFLSLLPLRISSPPQESALKSNLGKTAEVTYLSALLVWRKDRQKEQQLALLTESVDIHFRNIRGAAMGYVLSLYFLLICRN
jgi:hypothetical protein